MKSLVSAKNLSLTYHLAQRDLKAILVDWFARRPSHIEIPVIKNVSFDIYPGEGVCLVGANGVGKSSLLYAICGKMAPSGGTLEVRGQVAAFFGFPSGISVFESGYSALKFLTVFHGGSLSNFDRDVEDYSALSGLPMDLIRTAPLFSYSAGMKSRLIAAFSLYHHFDINIFDETLSPGDAIFNDFAARRIEKNQEKGASYIVVSHSRAFWEKWAEGRGRFLVLAPDGIAYDGLSMDQAWSEYVRTEKYKITVPR